MSVSHSLHAGPSHHPDRYRLTSIVGSGGESANVWLATEELDSGSQRVVVKQCPGRPDADDQDYWRHFGQFARALRHPHLVTVLDVFPGAQPHYAGEVPASPALEVTHDPTRRPFWYVVMTYEEGETLAEWLGENPQAKVSQKLRMMHTAASAIDALHAGKAGWGRPIIHGDIKPANVIIRPDGTLVLVDLGLSRIAGGAGRQGRTHAYAAPEITTTGTTPEADRFAFVMLLCHALTGAPPPVAPGSTSPDLTALAQRLHHTTSIAARTELLHLIVTAFQAPPADRPAPLGAWLSSLTGLLSATGYPDTEFDSRTSRRMAPPAPPSPAPDTMLLPQGHGLLRAGSAVLAVVVVVALIVAGAFLLPRLLDDDPELDAADRSAPLASPESAKASAQVRTPRATRTATETVTVEQTVRVEPDFYGELPAGTHRVDDTGYYTGGGPYRATVSTVVVGPDFVTVNFESRGYSDLRDPATSCLVSDDSSAYVYDFRPIIEHDDHYKGSLRFLNDDLTAPLRFLYSCASDYQDVVLFP